MNNWILNILIVSVTAVGAVPFSFASTSPQEQYFLKTRLDMVSYYQTSDQTKIDEFKSKCDLTVLPYEAVKYVRDWDLFLAGGEVIGAAAGGVDATSAALGEGTDLVVMMAKYPKLAGFLVSMGSSTLVSAIDHFNAGGEVDLSGVMTQVKQVIDDEQEIQDAYAIPASSEEESLALDQKSYAHYLSSRTKLNDIFDQAAKKIDAAPLSFSKVWNYGSDQVAYYDLGLSWGTTFGALDKIEMNHLENLLSGKL